MQKILTNHRRNVGWSNSPVSFFEILNEILDLRCKFSSRCYNETNDMIGITNTRRKYGTEKEL